MPEERITFERITQIYREEKRKKSLVPLPEDFFIGLKRYIDELQTKCEEEDKHSPHSPKSIMLRDELKKSLKKRDEIWKIRMRKLVTFASSKLMGASIDTKPFTKEESEIFENVVRILEEGTHQVHGTAGRNDSTGLSSKAFTEGEKRMEGPRKTDMKSSKGNMIETAIENALKPLSGHQESRGAVPKVEEERIAPDDKAIVHILEDLPPLAGADGDYHLKKDDIITLPKHLAKVLCDKNKAKIVETKIPI
jgi:DNA replication initiation complex subunit (GINS family)